MNPSSRSPSYLVKNPYSYCFRLVVPVDLQPVIQKKELRYSLQTGYLSEAKSKARLLAGNFQKLFRLLRDNDNMDRVTKETSDGIVQYFKDTALETILWDDGAGDAEKLTPIQLGEKMTRAKMLHASVASELETHSYGRVKGFVDDLIEGSPMAPGIEKDSPEYELTCKVLLEAESDFLLSFQERHAARIRELSDMFNRDGQTQQVIPTQTPEVVEDSISLEALIKLYFDENMRAGNWSPRTIPEYQSIFRNIVRLIGDQPVNQISKQSCQRFKQHLMGIPRNYFKATQKYAGKTIEQVVSEATPPLLSVGTVNKYLDNLSGLLKFGVNNSHFDSNYAQGLRIRQRKRIAHSERDKFSTDDLTTLFLSKGYVQDKMKTPWRFWLPILGLYTGCRLEELCQLRINDIKQINGIWSLDIRADERSGSRVKTESSERVVPLHPFIVEDLRVINFVDSIKTQGAERLFPELKKQSERYGHYPSRWFGTYKKKCGIQSPKKVFHSFRHNVQDELKQQIVPESIIEELVGHKLQGEGMGRYGKPYLAKVLYEEAILKLNYKVDLTHLKKSKYVIK